MVLFRAICVLAGLMSAFGVVAQEPEYSYPYETESKERIQMLLPDSVLFYRAIQSPSDLYAAITDYNLSFVRVERRGGDQTWQTVSVEGIGVPLRYFAALRSLGADESGYAGMTVSDSRLGLTGGVRMFRFSDEEISSKGRTSVWFSDRNYLVGARVSYAGSKSQGWSYAVTADLRTGHDLRVKGVFTNAVTASFRAAKRFAGGSR